MTNLSTLSSIQSGAVTGSNVIAVIPAIFGAKTSGITPVALPGSTGVLPQSQASFLFHYEGENKVTMESDITDHYTEYNSAIQDQIALRPITISVRGFIGELNNAPPFGDFGAAARTIADKLSGLSAIAPGLTTTAQNAYNQAAQTIQAAQSVFNTAKSVINVIPGGSGLLDTLGLSANGAQASAFLRFRDWWMARQLFTVQTPWASFKQMAILSCVPTQDETTSMITDFNITFKQISFSKTNYTTNYGSLLFNGGSAGIANCAPGSGNANPTITSPLANGVGLQ